METKLVNVRLPEELYYKGKELVKKEGFSNFQELIKEAVRRHIEESENKKFLEYLTKGLGSAKDKPDVPFTKEIREQIALDLLNNLSKQKETFKKFGL